MLLISQMAPKFLWIYSRFHRTRSAIDPGPACKSDTQPGQTVVVRTVRTSSRFYSKDIGADILGLFVAVEPARFGIHCNIIWTAVDFFRGAAGLSNGAVIFIPGGAGDLGYYFSWYFPAVRWQACIRRHSLVPGAHPKDQTLNFHQDRLRRPDLIGETKNSSSEAFK
jgi:hypothetical protein